MRTPTRCSAGRSGTSIELREAGWSGPRSVAHELDRSIRSSCWGARERGVVVASHRRRDFLSRFLTRFRGRIAIVLLRYSLR